MTTRTAKQLGPRICLVALCLAVSGAAWALPANAIPLGGWLEAQGSNVTRCIRVLTVIPGEALDQAGIRPAYDYAEISIAAMLAGPRCVKA